MAGATVGNESLKGMGPICSVPILSSFPTSRTGTEFSSSTRCVHHNTSDIPAPMDVLAHNSRSHERGFCAWWQNEQKQITWSNSLTRNVGYCWISLNLKHNKGFEFELTWIYDLYYSKIQAVATLSRVGAWITLRPGWLKYLPGLFLETL